MKETELYKRLRGLLKEGKSQDVIAELEITLAVGQDKDSVRVARDPLFDQALGCVDAMRYNLLPMPRGANGEVGAIESTIRRVINLRLKGNGIYWTEDNAEAIFQS